MATLPTLYIMNMHWWSNIRYYTCVGKCMSVFCNVGFGSVNCFNKKNSFT